MKLMFTMLGFGMIQGLWVTALAGNKRLQEEIVIATKFAAYPWRLTPSQFVNACRYAQLIMKYLDVCSLIMVRFWLWLRFGFWRASLDRIQIEQIGIGQLHWSTANYAPLQEKALWDGLVAMYEKVMNYDNSSNTLFVWLQILPKSWTCDLWWVIAISLCRFVYSSR